MRTTISIILFLLIVGFGQSVFGNNAAEIELKGYWKFSIGDEMQWAEKDFDDSAWDDMYVPSRWEENGYRGYDGYAWYRKNVEVPEYLSEREVYLELGYIDDVDEVYFNSVKIGQSGSFPPNILTAYNASRRYRVPASLIKFGAENTLAVRVYDSQLEGGIVRGNVKLVFGMPDVIPDIDLHGYWHFNKGKEPEAGATQILVPGAWENQGFNNYDGYAVYSKVVEVPAQLLSKKLILMAGRIDDDDRLFINGQFVAETGEYYGTNNTDMHREFRNYFIPDGVLKPGKNLIVLKIIDRGGEGGILEGNIGLITQEKFINYWQRRRKN
ncbi:MAG: glycoside hydrolase [Prolixibacteraceae bacterium]|nr:glycoside hydrolase [Prolixibacteraceae bacterium]